MNNQVFDPPLNAEERALWDQVFCGYLTHQDGAYEGSASCADDAIHERRRRFGVPEQLPVNFFASTFGGLSQHEANILRAEVERLTKERDELRARAEKAEAELAEATKGNKQWQEAYARSCDDNRRMLSRAEKAEAELDTAKTQRDAFQNTCRELQIKCDQLHNDLAAVQPVLEAVVQYVADYGKSEVVSPWRTMVNYHDRQRAKRAGGAT